MHVVCVFYFTSYLTVEVPGVDLKVATIQRHSRFRSPNSSCQSPHAIHACNCEVNHRIPTTVLCCFSAPSSPPQSVMLSPVSSTSIGLAWAPPAIGDRNGVITQYRITITVINTGQVISLTSNSVSTRVTGLHPYYVYECIISAFTVGIGPYSQALQITTPEDGNPTANYSAPIMLRTSCV